MKLVTSRIHYAIKSLVYISKEPNRVVSVNELVTKLNMRRAFLRRILQMLSKNKVLKSSKGRNGGFSLNKKPNKLRIIDIMEIFRKKTDVMSCLFEGGICPYPDNCPLMNKMKEAERKLHNALKTITIAALLKNRKK